MSVQQTYDVIVLGVGSMGSATCYHLAKRGMRVLGLEQFAIPHEQGSHAGQSRIIRKAYFEHPDYVPLLELAYRNWKALEDVTGEQVYHRTGLLYWGPTEHPVVQGVLDSSRQYNIPLEQLEASAYPQLSIPTGSSFFCEPDAGFVTPEKAIRLYVREAVRLGADVRQEVKVSRWEQLQDRIAVYSSDGVHYARKLVITAGPWAALQVPSLNNSLTVTKQVLAWVMPEDPAAYSLGNFPCWMAAEDGVPGVFYGFPMLAEGRIDGPMGFKLAHHAPGVNVDPNAVDRTIGDDDILPLRAVLDRYFRNGYSYTLASKTCLYTNTPDEHFIIDLLPGNPNVAVAAGFSGHGFKFASAIGEILADLAVVGQTDHPVGFLGIHRLGHSSFANGH